MIPEPSWRSPVNSYNRPYEGSPPGCPLACDLTVVPTGSSFALPETQIGAYAFYGVRRLARPIGRQRAADLVFAGRELDAATALDRGAVRSLRRSGRGGRGRDRARGLDRAVLPGQPGDRHGLAETPGLTFPGENHGMWTGLKYLFAGPTPARGAASFLEDRDPDFAE